MVATPEMPNEKPEISQAGAEVVQNFQSDIQQASPDILSKVSGDKSTGSYDLAELAITADKSETVNNFEKSKYDQDFEERMEAIQKMTPDQIKQAITAQESVSAGLTNLIAREEAKLGSAEKLQQAELLAQANAANV
jgi:hypothetical protein